jgi:hypothetical protein
VRDCLLEAHGGIVMDQISTGLNGVLGGSVKRCWLRPANIPGHLSRKLSVGIFGNSNQFVVEMCDLNGFYTGIGATGGSIRDCRIEMCYIGIKLGIDLRENGYPDGGEISSSTFDGNAISIWLNDGTIASTQIRGVDVLGEPFAPTLQETNDNAIAGIKIERFAKRLVFQNFAAGGDFSDGAHASGDAINAVLAAAEYNFRRLLAWLRLLLLRILIALGLAAQLKSAFFRHPGRLQLVASGRSLAVVPGNCRGVRGAGVAVAAQ